MQHALCGWIFQNSTWATNQPQIRHNNTKTNTSGGTFYQWHLWRSPILSYYPTRNPTPSEGILIPLKELMAHRDSELYWMNKLKTKATMGINKRIELPPPTQFVIKFSDQSGKMTQLTKTYFTKIKEGTPGPFYKAWYLGATSRDKNLKHILARTSLKWNTL